MTCRLSAYIIRGEFNNHWTEESRVSDNKGDCPAFELPLCSGDKELNWYNLEIVLYMKQEC